MKLDDVWLSDDVFDRKVDYLAYSFHRIDAELFSAFHLLPFREQNLDVSSMFFADICLRLYPLLTIGFNILTFGNLMKEQVIHWMKSNEEGKFPFYISGFQNFEYQ